MTSQVARAALPQGNSNLTLRDELGVIFADAEVPMPTSTAMAVMIWPLVRLMRTLTITLRRQAVRSSLSMASQPVCVI
jgi:hypothetical protein